MSNHPITPIPVPTPIPGDAAPVKLVISFGGTFDPPHRGHVELPVKVRDELEKREGCPGGAWLIYVPAARSPHKNKGPSVTDAQRTEMLRLAIQGVPRSAVWTDEIDRATGGGEPSYSIDTIRRARESLDSSGHSGARLRLLIGADQALGFHRWKDPRAILAIAAPAVMVRDDVDRADELVRRLSQTSYWKRPELDLWREAIVSVGRMDVSATAVRETLRSSDEGAAAKYLDKRVLAYIRENGLYTSQ